MFDDTENLIFQRSTKPTLATPVHIKHRIFDALHDDYRERMQDDPDGHGLPKIPARVYRLVEDAIKKANDEAEAGNDEE